MNSLYKKKSLSDNVMKNKVIFLRLIKEGIIFAFNSISVNKLRTFLTLFGITIGIVSIISVFTVLDWMEKSIRDSISTLGDNVIYVQKFPWSFDPNLNWWDIVKWPPVSIEDYEAVSNKSKFAQSTCFTVYRPVVIKFENNSINNANILASTIEYKDIRNFEIEKGRYFSIFEAKAGKNVAILGAEIASRLFENREPIGKEIIIAGFKTTVIGVIRKEGKGGISDSGMDEITLVPLNFAKSFINLRRRSAETQIMIKAKPQVPLDELSDEITMILRVSRRLRPGEISNFSVNKASLLTQGFNTVFAGINAGGWLIGGFAILVGGFGIANIMFVSVKERTNIIGIQKALGAKRFFILLQFLSESVMLSLMGGILGLFFVFLGTLVVNYLYEMNMFLTLGNILLGIFISGIIGIVAGYAPAYTAAKMNPVDAIGYSF
ncbi:MAG TPA: ABC transporter permease [Bacteroidales bacterium]|nr:ABC transporter permease [Bacteroidales bacterium]HQJ21004.1 ABC transporter permease [Bacteroidales bacterium]